MLMRNKLVFGLIGIFAILYFTGCQDVFTYSVMAPLATPASELSGEQLESYAEEVLTSGNSEAMEEAYTAIVEELPDTAEEDPELYLLATDLAIGGSGISGAVTEGVSMITEIEEMTEEEITTAVTDIIEGIDDTLLSTSLELFEDVADLAADPDSEVVIDESQYTNAAVAQIFVVFTEAEEANEEIDLDDPRLEQAADWAALGGFDESLITGMLGGFEEE